jgi:hypothetical protein
MKSKKTRNQTEKEGPMFGVMQNALAKVAPDGDLGKMIARAAERAEEEKKQRRIQRAAKKRKLSAAEAAKRYELNITKTSRQGIGSLRPCSILSWRTARPALANGKPCIIRWGLSDGELQFVVVEFECPQPFVNLSGKNSKWGFFSVNQLKPCDCRGYIHKRCRKRGSKR